MKRWICENIFGEPSESVDTFGLASSLAIMIFLVGSWTYLFVILPVVFLIL